MSTGNTKSFRAELRTKVLNYIRKMRKPMLISDAAQEMVELGMVTLAEVGELFGMSGFKEFMRKTAGEVDPISGAPAAIKVGESFCDDDDDSDSKHRQGYLWLTRPRTSFEQKDYNLCANIKSVEVDMKKARLDRIMIENEHPDRVGDLRRGKPGWLFDEDEMAGAV